MDEYYYHYQKHYECFWLRALYYFHLSLIETTPGNSFPSMNSSVTPPPVDACVTLSLYPSLVAAATMSPPPNIVLAFKVTSLASTLSVPLV